MKLHFDELKKYVMKRKEAFEIYSGISDTIPELSPYRDVHLANNLRYLDEQSQELISVVNNPRNKIEDKLLTAFVYALVPDKFLLRRYSNERGMFTLDRLYEFASYLDRSKYVPNMRYATPIQKSSKSGLPRGKFVLACSEAFMSTLPVDYFYKWNTRDIFKFYTTFKDVYGVTRSMAIQLSLNLSYINELQIEITDTFEVSHHNKQWIRESFNIDSSVRIVSNNTTEIYNEFSEWYSTLDFKDNRERLIIPSDIPHLCKQWHEMTMYREGRYAGKLLKRNGKYKNTIGGKKPLHNIENYVVPDSIYEYWKKRVHN